MLLQTQLLTPMLEPVCLTKGLKRQQKSSLPFERFVETNTQVLNPGGNRLAADAVFGVDDGPSRSCSDGRYRDLRAQA